MTESVLRARGVTRILAGDVPVTLVDHADLDLAPGELVAIMGPSGSGKSSLLYLLGLLDPPTSGTIWIDAVDTSTYSEQQLAEVRLSKLGFIFQSHFLLPEFTALENVTLPMQRRAVLTPQKIHERGIKLLSDLGLKEHVHKIPRKLSGGQCQRVAIARALANDPVLILADEPTGNLDSTSSAQVRDILRTLVRDFGRTVAVVTHEENMGAAADRTIRIVDGRIVAA